MHSHTHNPQPAGERYDFVINADQPVGAYWVQLRGLGECGIKRVQQLAILRYARGPYQPASAAPSYDVGIPQGVVSTASAWRAPSDSCPADDDDDDVYSHYRHRRRVYCMCYVCVRVCMYINNWKCAVLETITCTYIYHAHVWYGCVYVLRSVGVHVHTTYNIKQHAIVQRSFLMLRAAQSRRRRRRRRNEN